MFHSIANGFYDAFMMAWTFLLTVVYFVLWLAQQFMFTTFVLGIGAFLGAKVVFAAAEARARRRWRHDALRALSSGAQPPAANAAENASQTLPHFAL
jgi:hypothetical protein